MSITIASIFANATHYLRRYFAQCVALSDALHARGDKPTFLWGEGDSTDHTRRMLEAMRWRLNSRVVDVTHGGQIFGSVVREERFRQLAEVGRKLWSEVPADSDVVLWVESDLIWSVETALGLIDRVGRPVYPRYVEGDYYAYTPGTIPTVTAVAPPIVLERAGWPRGGRTFYDTAFFIKDGRHFEHRPPWHPGNAGALGARPMMEMERVGSMIAIDADYFRKAAQSYDERVLGGLCDDIRALGGTVWFAADLPGVTHE